MVGQSMNHSEDIYRLHKPETKRIILSRDMIWSYCNPNGPRQNMGVFAKYDSMDILPRIREMIVEVINVPEIEVCKVYYAPDYWVG